MSAQTFAESKRDPTQEALLQTIFDHPDSDAARLVYADWLDENGNPERAEFIRVQCELAQMEAPFAHPLCVFFTGGIEELYLFEGCIAAYQHGQANPIPSRIGELLERRAQLLKQHRKEWLEELPSSVQRQGFFFRRGFIEGVRTTCSALSEDGHDFAPAVPLRYASLQGTRREFLKLAEDSPPLRRLKHLTFYSSDTEPINSQEATLLNKARYLSTIGSLSLPSQRDLMFATSLLTDIPFERLEGLGMPYCESGNDVLSMLLLQSSTNLRYLRALDVSGLTCRPDTLAALANAIFSSWLTHLFMRDSAGLRKSHMQSLFGRRKPGALLCLDLGNNQLDADSIAPLCESPWMQTVQVLSLGENRLGNPGATLLAESPYLRNLIYLHLGANRISNRGIAALAQSPNLANVRHLVLDRNDITNEGGRLLAKSPYLQNVRILRVGHSFDAEVKQLLKQRFGQALIW